MKLHGLQEIFVSEQNSNQKALMRRENFPSALSFVLFLKADYSASALLFSGLTGQGVNHSAEGLVDHHSGAEIDGDDAGEEQ